VKPFYHNTILLLSGLWLFGIGSRMITQFITGPDMIYLPPTPTGDTWGTWDYWFDWFPMVPLGTYLIISSFLKNWKYLNSKNVIQE
jgi:hypothetical protein